MPQVYWDINLLIGAFATFAFFLLVYNLLKHMKNGGSFLTAKGNALFITSLGVLQGVGTVQVNYTDPIILPVEWIIGNVGVYFFIAGMACFVACAEVDIVRHVHRSGNLFKKYSKSCLLLVIFTALSPFLARSLLFDPSKTICYLYAFYMLIVPIFFHSVIKFINKFSTLRTVRKKHPARWIISGFIASFIGLVFYNNFFWNKAIWPIWPATPFITSGSMLAGGVLMSRGWEHMPNLTELSWLSSLEYLYVIFIKDSLVLFEYPFQYDKASGLVKKSSDLVSGLLGALDDFAQETLASQHHLKEFRIEGKIVSCTYRRYCAFVVFATEMHEEFLSRLYEFADDFEKSFAKKLNEAHNCNIPEYNQANQLVIKHFT
nr:hypothetical protein [Candidatus Sigynarchaeota archaeon]